MSDAQKKFGIVVGVSEYDRNEQFSKLPFANNDAIAVYSTLRDSCGFDPNHLRLLVHSDQAPKDIDSQPPSRANILNVVKYVAKNSNENDLVLVFFAGHGVEISKIPYLICEDTRMNVLAQTAIDVSELNQMVEESLARCVVRVFDACRTPFGIGRGETGRMTDILQSAMLQSVKGWATISSCSPGEVAFEIQDVEQGVFSHYFCEGLKGKAANEEGTVTLEGLVEYVKISVGNWCESQTLKQTPHFQSDISGVLVLSSVAKPKQIAPLPAESPFAKLQSGLQLHLSSSPSDARNLTFTHSEEMEVFCDHVFQNVRAFIDDFVSPSLEISIWDRKLLADVSPDLWGTFVQDIKRRRVREEFRNEAQCVPLRFESSEVIVPSSTLYVTAVRFSFFYWLWYAHLYEISQLHSEFKPESRQHVGFFTFKPSAARNPQKVESAVGELFSRASEAQLEWAKQLGEFVNARLDPLREIDPIID